MSATRYDAEERYERFAVLRAQYPKADFEEVMDRIREEEDEAAERAHFEMLDSIDEERAERHCAADGERFMDRAYAAGNL